MDSQPSSWSGNSVNMSSATTSPSTASPRNSSRSLGARPGCSAHQERWRTASASSCGLGERVAEALGERGDRVGGPAAQVPTRPKT